MFRKVYNPHNPLVIDFAFPTHSNTGQRKKISLFGKLQTWELCFYVTNQI